MPDGSLLREFVYGFYGYGSYQAPFWFVGMEEGGGGSIEEIQQRLTAWDVRGHRELEDVAGYHRAIGITRFWDEPVRMQSTWNKLIRVVMSARGQIPSAREVKEYQRDQLGRENGETCLLELMPLPSPSTGKWLYGSHSRLPFLATRTAYLEEVSSTRIRHLRDKIREYQPSWVLFYGMGYLNYWREIVGVPLENQGNDDLYIGTMGKTVLLIVKHPSTRGITNDYFHEVGSWVSTAIAR